MRRYWTDQELVIGTEEELSSDLFHHICGVCRLDVGAKFELISPQQRAFFVELIDKNNKKAVIRVLEERILKDLKRPYVKLCLSIPKFATFEKVIEKSVELGVHSVQPFFSDYSFVHSASKISESKWQRWQKIVKGASQQTGRSPLMEISSAKPLAEIFQGFNLKQDVGGLFLYEGKSSLQMSEALANANQQKLSEIWVFIGSEGGFSDREVELFNSNHLAAVSLGDQVLRVETACVAVTSIIKYGLDIF